MRLSENFNLAEFTQSETASREKIDNTPSKRSIENLAALCVYVLQPIRDQFGVVQILSGYRSESLNNIVGGVPDSDHMFGYCADFTTPKQDMRKVLEWLVNSSIAFHQLIDCIQFYNMIHVSYKHNSNQILLRDSHGKYKSHPFAKRASFV